MKNPNEPRTPSEAKINANRENAQKSTGPRSAEGKAASSRNRLLHGLRTGHKYREMNGIPQGSHQTRQARTQHPAPSTAARNAAAAPAARLLDISVRYSC